VYLEAAARLGVDPAGAAAVEDSASGIQAAHAAGLAVVAIPNPAFPPADETLAAADVVLDSVRELTAATVASLRPG
jgi:beta-phosphoglucomutase-like phosphatase (HAD superfamily)